MFSCFLISKDGHNVNNLVLSQACQAKQLLCIAHFKLEIAHVSEHKSPSLANTIYYDMDVRSTMNHTLHEEF